MTYLYVYACVCVRVFSHTYTHTHVPVRTYNDDDDRSPPHSIRSNSKIFLSPSFRPTVGEIQHVAGDCSGPFFFFGPHTHVSRTGIYLCLEVYYKYTGGTCAYGRRRHTDVFIIRVSVACMRISVVSVLLCMRAYIILLLLYCVMENIIFLWHYLAFFAPRIHTCIHTRSYIYIYIYE